MIERYGKTLILKNKPSIIGYGSIVGKKEHEGPLSNEFDEYIEDSYFGEDSYEKAESKLQKNAVEHALKRANLNSNDIDNIFAGDLLNQCISSSFGLRDFNIPFIGLYGACSTMALSTALASVFVNCGVSKYAVAVTSSHFCSAERQFRFPLGYGNQRTPTAQWTVTGSGALVIGNGEELPYINAVSFGAIMDLGIKDANNMGAAMAPAAADTISNFFKDTNTKPEDYDIIYTGDLGRVGTELLYDLMDENGYNLRCRHADCGNIIFSTDNQDVHAGGSGCGCSASVLASFVMHRFEEKKFKNILFVSTGALMSPTSSLQGESIPGIAHLLNIKKY